MAEYKSPGVLIFERIEKLETALRKIANWGHHEDCYDDDCSCAVGIAKRALEHDKNEQTQME